MDDGITLSSSDYAMTSNKNKNSHSTFKIHIKVHCLSIKSEDDVLFKIRLKETAFVPSPLKAMLKSGVDRLSLQKLEY